MATQSWVNMVYRRGLRTHPCGAPVLRISRVEMLFPTVTTWGLPVRMSRTQLHRTGSTLQPRLCLNRYKDKIDDLLPPAVMECFLTRKINWLIPPGDLEELCAPSLTHRKCHPVDFFKMLNVLIGAAHAKTGFCALESFISV